MSKYNEHRGLAIACAVLFIPAAVASTLLRAWALVTVWSWYLAGFAGLPELSYKVAIGVAMLFGFWTGHLTNKWDKEMELPKLVVLAATHMFAVPLAFVAASWVWLQVLS